MRKVSIPLCLLVMAACQQPAANKTPSASGTDTAKQIAETPKSITDLASAHLVSEHIDGPANIREYANGKVLFTLEDQVTVETNEPDGGWLAVGVIVDESNLNANDEISKGTTLTSKGKVIGKAMEDLSLSQIIGGEKGKRTVVISGITTMENIRKETLIEHAFAQLATEAGKQLTLDKVKPLLQTFECDTLNGLMDGIQSYVYYEAPNLIPESSVRFWTVFRGNEIIAVFHSRPMQIPGVRTEKDPAGFVSIFSKDEALIKKLRYRHTHYFDGTGYISKDRHADLVKL